MRSLDKERKKLKPNYLDRGELARLIPTAADSNKEAKATSVLLATLMAVPAFSNEILSTIGQRVGQRTKVGCFTEVRFSKEKDTNLRPDGLINLKGTQGRTWSCLVEAKIDNQELVASQVEDYLKLARRNSIDAVLTLSNQPVAHPTHTPVKVSGNLQRSVNLYHISWMNLLTNAQLLLDEDKFESEAQKYILREFIRFMGHPSSGVKRFDKMNSEWREICSQAISKVTLNKTDDMIENTIAAWHQEARDACLIMSEKLNRSVKLRLPKAHAKDPAVRVKDDCDKLVKDLELHFALDVPDAAAPLEVTANLRSRVIAVSMSLEAPKDKKRATSRVSWLLRQLSKTNTENIYIRSNWPNRTQSIQAKLEEAREDPSILIEGNTTNPRSFDVVLIRDIAGKFSGNKKFIEEIEDAVPYFYSEAGQRLQAYIPPAPEIKKTNSSSRGDEEATRNNADHDKNS